MTTPDDETARRPFLRIVRGDPTEEELAALVTVLASVGSAPEPDRTPPPDWAAHHRKVRVTLPHGPGGWRSSSLPR